MKTFCVAIVLLLVGTAPTASAQGFFLSPFIDTTLTSPSGAGGASHAGFGVSFGRFRGGIVGNETEVTYHPQIVDNEANDVAKSHVVTAFENLLIGPRIHNARAYGTIGIGDIYLNVSSKSLAAPTDINTIAQSISNNYISINFGGGAMYFFSKRVAARGDLRYFKAFGIKIPEDDSGSLDLTHLNKFTFWRASFGATFAF